MVEQTSPRVDYLSRDFSSLRASLLEYASQRFPDWQPASEGDFGMLMVELFSYLGDISSYYTDRAQMENYLSTATQRESVLGIAYGLGYAPTPGSPASGTVLFYADVGTTSTIIPARTQIHTGRIEALDDAVIFETDVDILVPPQVAVTEATPLVLVAADVTEGETILFEKIEESSGQPNQFYSLPHTGIYTDTIRVYIEDALGSTTFTAGGQQIRVREWLRKEHLLDADDVDTSFETFLGRSSTTSILFGDDINGAIPATGLQIFASYRHGFGLGGNVAQGQAYLVNSRTLRGIHVAKDEVGVYLSGPMVGGADPESTDSIRHNAPRAYRTQNRAVTEKDFRDVALGVEGVTKANVVVSSFSSVTVYITGPDGGEPSQSLLDYVESKFKDKTLIGVNVQIAVPDFVPVNFGSTEDLVSVPAVVDNPVIVEVFDQYSQAAVRANIETALRLYISRMVFGRMLTVGKAYDIINDVEGVQSVDVNVMVRGDSSQVGTAKIKPRPWEVFTMGTIRMDITGGVS